MYSDSVSSYGECVFLVSALSPSGWAFQSVEYAPSNHVVHSQLGAAVLTSELRTVFNFVTQGVRHIGHDT